MKTQLRIDVEQGASAHMAECGGRELHHFEKVLEIVKI